jgi:hypothetical protein
MSGSISSRALRMHLSAVSPRSPTWAVCSTSETRSDREERPRDLGVVVTTESSLLHLIACCLMWSAGVIDYLDAKHAR